MKVDLNNCDIEPIHIPGRIQSFGFFVAADGSGIITHCSQNIASFLPVAAKDLIGAHCSSLANYFDSPAATVPFNDIISQDRTGLASTINNPYPISIGGAPWNLLAVASANGFLFDLEPDLSDLSGDLLASISSTLTSILSETILDALLHRISQQVRKLIRYDRVMIYKFHDDGHGEVVAEDKATGLESWLGLHYPASDIPQQARALYKINLVRLIADVHTEPSALVTRQEVALDLTHSGLRAVSPIHIQYLKNMGVASSFSVSIIDQGKLWGLIACHNYTPRFINYRQREAAKLIGQVLSSAVSFRQAEKDQVAFQQLKNGIAELTRALLRDVSVPSALLKQPTTLLDAAFAQGAVLYYEGVVYSAGAVPPEAFVHELIEWLIANTGSDIFATAQLSEQFAHALDHTDTASGLLSCRLSSELSEYLLWFKPAVLTTVKWAGNPEKPVEMVDGMLTISPRQSFASWSQLVTNRSSPWLSVELDAAKLLRDEISYAVGRKATELRMINEKLRAAYAELDAFSYTISHDLKNPIQAIKGFAQIIKLQDSDPEVTTMAERIEDRAKQVTGMINEVLQYSRVGQTKVSTNAINMQKVLADIRQDLLVAYTNPNLIIDIEATPELQGDETMLFQVFSNLVGNAVKYSSKRSAPLVVVRGEKTPTHITYSISDNGIGIPDKDRDRIFDLFTRSVSEQEFEGSGVGLAIVKRILDRHEGEIWVDSVPELGSTFFVRFKIK